MVTSVRDIQRMRAELAEAESSAQRLAALKALQVEEGERLTAQLLELGFSGITSKAEKQLDVLFADISGKVDELVARSY